MPIIYHVDRVRDGRSFCTRTVRATQAGSNILTMQVKMWRILSINYGCKYVWIISKKSDILPRPQWVNSLGSNDAIWRWKSWSTLVGPLGTNFSEFLIKILAFPLKKKWVWWCRLPWPQCVKITLATSLLLTIAQLQIIIRQKFKFLWSVFLSIDSGNDLVSSDQDLCHHLCVWAHNDLSRIIIIYHQTSSIKCTKSQNLNVSHLVLQLFLPNSIEARC